jgi:hypothetical protein
VSPIGYRVDCRLAKMTLSRADVDMQF